jgi:ketosteroid isomerase-like protein
VTRTVLGIGAIAFAMLAAGCAERVANRCPDTAAPKCMTGTVCAMDESRGCQVCRCDTPYMVPESQPPQGMPQPMH